MSRPWEPPLLALAQGRKVRARRMVASKQKELALHIPVAKLLRDHCLPDWQWAHYPGGEVLDIRTAAKLKAMGRRRGWPDFIFISPWGSIRCLELKRSSGAPLTEEQAEFRLWCIKHGVPYVVAWTIDQVLAAFDSWGCTRLPKRGGGSPVVPSA